MAKRKNLSKNEIIRMVKQLGMMHLLYYTRKKMYMLTQEFPDCIKRPPFLGSPTIEDALLKWMSTENEVIERLDCWEKGYNWDHSKNNT